MQEHERLREILLAIAKIETAQQRGRDAFEADEMIQVWMKYHLQIIGEVSRSLDPLFRRSYSAVPWEKIIGLRNILVHQYGSIINHRIWEIIEKDVPELKKMVSSLLDPKSPEN